MRRWRTPSVIETAAGDAMFTFCAGIVTALKDPADEDPFLTLFMINTLMSALHLVFHNYSNNPISQASKYAAGLERSGLLVIALRSVAQAAGAVGCAALVERPEREMKRRQPTASVERRAMLTVAVAMFDSLVEFWIDAAIRGFYSRSMTYWTYGLLKGFFFQWMDKAGGVKISMNPTKDFGTAFVKNRLTGEHFFLSWICPFVGAITAAWIFWILKKVTSVLVFILYIMTCFRTT